MDGLVVLGMIFAIPGAGLSPRAGPNNPISPQAQVPPANEIQDFSPLSTSSGWVLLDSRLYITLDNGDNWQDITPAFPSAANLLAVTFLDAETGWVLWADPQTDGNLDLQISSTSDGGLTWESRLVQTISPDDPDSFIESARMDWLDASTGWVSIKRQTGTNFSAGVLFHTMDGGGSWTRSVLPAGEPVHFIDRLVGWMAGGPALDQLFKTENAGLTWAEQPLPADVQSDQVQIVYVPIFDPAGNGLLPVIVSEEAGFEVRFYTSVDGGRQWIFNMAFPLGLLNGTLPLTLLDPQNALASVPADNRLLQVTQGRPNTLANQDGMSADITELRMLSPDFGWAKWNTSACTRQASTSSDGATDINCTASTELIRTVNAGVTWEDLLLPAVHSKTLVQSSSTTTSSPSQIRAASAVNTQIYIGQGFDVCAIPSLDQLNTWNSYSPYGALNIYIGGAARAHGCDNSPLTASFLAQARAQSWTFIPTWVGPQAPCTTYNAKFSSNVDQAFLDGKNEANLAVDTLAILNLTTADKKGSIVYYDLETFFGDQACMDAAKSFMNGWVSQLHLLGNLAGIYGSTGCKSGILNYWQIANRPDAIWPAIWDHSAGNGSYNPDASLWNLGCIPNDIWASHQRIRQYEGAHNEKWGTATLNIDNDVLDGIVAIPNQGPPPTPPSASFLASPTNGTGPLTVTFYIVNAANITSCSWVYGDGQTGTSCAAAHTHTYTSSGSYSVTLTVQGPGGWDDLTRGNYISVSEASMPDLIPYPRAPGTDPVTISSITGTFLDDTLYANQPVFIDWGFKNIGTANANAVFTVALFIDGQRILDYPFAGLGAGLAGGYNDTSFTWNTSGWHTVSIIVDPENSIVESNENNNTWSGLFYWETIGSVGPTLISPTGVITNNLPDFKWLPLNSMVVISYDFYVNSLTPGGIITSQAGLSPGYYCTTSICTFASHSPLVPGDYQFKIGARNNYGIVTYSPWQIFTVSGLPTAPTITAPSGTVTSASPVFSWSKSTAASWYELYIYPAGSSTPRYSQTSIPAIPTCTASTCTWNSAPVLERGNYQIKLRAANQSGVSPYSEGSFYVDADISKVFLPFIER